MVQMMNYIRTLIKFGNKFSRPILVTKGLHQWSSLLPIVFNRYFEAPANEWKTQCSGMSMPMNGKYLYSLHFAVDQVIIAQELYDLKCMLRMLY